jgi:hypothetical protein
MLILVDGCFTTLNGRCAKREPAIPPRSTHGVRLLNHVVRAQQQGLRNREAERLGRLEVNYQLNDRQLQYWQIGGLAALQDSADIDTGFAIHGTDAWSVAEQAPSGGELTDERDRGNLLARSERGDLTTLTK